MKSHTIGKNLRPQELMEKESHCSLLTRGLCVNEEEVGNVGRQFSGDISKEELRR